MILSTVKKISAWTLNCKSMKMPNVWDVTWYIWHAYWYTIYRFLVVCIPAERKVLALGRKKYTIFTLWCLFTAQNRTSHYYFPFTVGFIISLHRFVPSLHCSMRGLGGSQYLPLTNLATFSSFMHKTKLLPCVIQVTSRPPYSTSSTSLCI